MWDEEFCERSKKEKNHFHILSVARKHKEKNSGDIK